MIQFNIYITIFFGSTGSLLHRLSLVAVLGLLTVAAAAFVEHALYGCVGFSGCSTQV